MLQHVEQGCEPRGVLGRLGRDITHAAKCAARAHLALDLVVSPNRSLDEASKTP